MTGHTLPKVNRWLLNWFAWYANGLVKKHFHTVRLLCGKEPTPDADRGLLVYLNHPSWWDPVICLFCQRLFFSQRTHYAIFEEKALANYAFFRKLGAIGVDDSSPASVLDFLRIGRRITADRKSALWVTPQGAFTDVRSRPTTLKPGILRLIEKNSAFDFLPMAIEYPFWEEKFPEALVAFGSPIPCETIDRNDATSRQLVEPLTSLQNELADAAIARDANRFEVLAEGRYGVGGVYDIWRRFVGWLQGRTVAIRHGEAPR